MQQDLQQSYFEIDSTLYQIRFNSGHNTPRGEIKDLSYFNIRYFSILPLKLLCMIDSQRLSSSSKCSLDILLSVCQR